MPDAVPAPTAACRDSLCTTRARSTKAARIVAPPFTAAAQGGFFAIQQYTEVPYEDPQFVGYPGGPTKAYWLGALSSLPERRLDVGFPVVG